MWLHQIDQCWSHLGSMVLWHVVTCCDHVAIALAIYCLLQEDGNIITFRIFFWGMTRMTMENTERWWETMRDDERHVNMFGLWILRGNANTQVSFVAHRRRSWMIKGDLPQVFARYPNSPILPTTLSSATETIGSTDAERCGGTPKTGVGILDSQYEKDRWLSDIVGKPG